jgi:hypothetical protein
MKELLLSPRADEELLLSFVKILTLPGCCDIQTVNGVSKVIIQIS